MSVLRSSGISMKLIFQLNVNLFKELRICSHTTGTTGYAKSNQKPSPLFKSNADTELRIYKLLNTHSLECVWWGKSKPVKARLVDRKIDEMWTKYDEGVITISNFFELACNFFEPDRDPPRPTFDTSARSARPDGNARRSRATAGQARVPRQMQPAEVQPADADGRLKFVIASIHVIIHCIYFYIRSRWSSWALNCVGRRWSTA